MTKQSSTRILSVSDLNTDITENEPRIRDVRLGERLGMSQPLNIRKTVEKNRAELEQYGPIHAAREMVGIGSKARRSVDEYWLNEAQALLLCMFARTDKAAMVRKEVIEIYLAVRHGQTAPALPKPRTLTNVQARTLQRMIRERWSDSKERDAAYERLKDRFEVPKYKQIAREDFEAAVGFIADDSPTPIPPFLRDGRYLLVVDGGKTLLRDAGDKSLIDNKHVRTLLRNFRTLTSQMRVCFGEVGDETMELPIEALKRKVTP